MESFTMPLRAFFSSGEWQRWGSGVRVEGTDVVGEDGGEKVTAACGAQSTIDPLEKAFQPQGLEIRDAKLPESACSRGGTMKAKSPAKRSGDDLVQGIAVGFGRSPVLCGIQHLGDEDGLDSSRSHKRPRRRISTTGDEVGCDLALMLTASNCRSHLPLCWKMRPRYL